MSAHGSYKRRNKGIGNVIATIIFVFLMIYTIGQLYIFSFNLNDDYYHLAGHKFEEQLKKSSEKVSITNIDLTANGLLRPSLTVSNSGGETATLVSLWLINVTDNDHKRFNISTIVAAGGAVSGIGPSLYLRQGKSYTFRVVSERGNAASASMIPASGSRLDGLLTCTPCNPITGNNITLVYFVKNNVTGADFVYNFLPQITLNLGAGASATIVSGPTPPSAESLHRDESALFKWIYFVTGTPDSAITFNATYLGAPQGDFSLAEVIIRPVGGVSQQNSTFSPATTSFDSSFGLKKNKEGTQDLAPQQNAWLQITMPPSSPAKIWLTVSSRLIFTSTSTGQLYAGAFKSWAKGEQNGQVDSEKDSITVGPGDTVHLEFSAPSLTASGQKYGAGTYSVSMFLFGYDERGQIYIQKFSMGTITV